jgi:signal transduction histidine kinase
MTMFVAACPQAACPGETMSSKMESAADSTGTAALKEVLRLQQAEQRMIAYDIHDGVLQDVIAAKMCAEAHLEEMKKQPVVSTAALQQVIELLERAIDEGRRLVNRLRPLSYGSQGLSESLRRWAQELELNTGFCMQLDCQVTAQQVSAPLSDATWRIVREAVMNAVRHSGCRQAQVRIWQEDSALHLEIRDAGVGFDPQKVSEGHFGLEAMRQRAVLYGGEVSITSAPGQGTRVLVQLPLDGGQWLTALRPGEMVDQGQT